MTEEHLKISWNWLGRTDYADCFALQEKIREKVLDGELDGHLILTEHEKVFTFGRRESGENLLFAPDFLTQKGFSVVKSSRGGLVTYHGPGQLVIYPILNLKKLKLKLKEYVEKLETSVIGLLSKNNISARRREGYPGVWLSDRQKIGSLGIHVKKMVTLHGFALNVFTDLADFEYINPCGFKELDVTSMNKEGCRINNLEDLIPAYINSFETVFGVKLEMAKINT